METTEIAPGDSPIFFKRVVPKGRYYTLSAVTISLYVCVCRLGGGQLNMVKFSQDLL